MRCPGQDTRYWQGDAAFEVPCPKCGRSVELFKDESSARCTQCGHRFGNPRLDLQCAQWCAHAKECLGFLPDDPAAANLGEGALASLLLRAVKEAFPDDQTRITRALVVFGHTKELASKEGGDPRVILAAALLRDVDPSPQDPVSAPAPVQRPRHILQEIGLPEDVIEQACQTIDQLRSGQPSDTIAWKVVHDAYRLADMASEDYSDPEQVENIIAKQLTTEAARQRARRFFLSQ